MGRNTDMSKRAQAKINKMEVGQATDAFKDYYRAEDGSIRKNPTRPGERFEDQRKPQVKKGVKLTKGQRRKIKEKLKK